MNPDPASRTRTPRRAPTSAATRRSPPAALLAMVALTAASWFMPRGYWTDLLQAASRAGVIGGLADWFAVTALFRHPLGLPIPHTAIIPRQKARLGAALGRFVANQVFTEQDVTRLLARIDAAGALRALLADPATARPVASAIAGAPAAAARQRAERPRPPPDCPHAAAAGRRCGHRRHCRPRPAQPGRRRPPPGSLRLYSRTTARRHGRAGGHAAPHGRGPGARTGRPPGRLGHRRQRRPPRADRRQRRIRENGTRRFRPAHRLRRMDPPRDRPHRNRPRPRRRTRPGHQPRADPTTPSPPGCGMCGTACTRPCCATPKTPKAGP